jgi:hypothetical protein
MLTVRSHCAADHRLCAAWASPRLPSKALNQRCQGDAACEAAGAANAAKGGSTSEGKGFISERRFIDALLALLIQGFKRVFYVLRDSYAELWMTLFLTMLTLVIFSTAM